MDELCDIGLTGTQLINALENGVSKWPALEGRFPQVAGIRFLFDPTRAPGERVIRSSVQVGDERNRKELFARHVFILGSAICLPEVAVGKDCPPSSW